MKTYSLKQAPNFPQKKVSAIKPFHTWLMSVDDSILPSQVKLFIDKIVTKSFAKSQGLFSLYSRVEAPYNTINVCWIETAEI